MTPREARLLQLLRDHERRAGLAARKLHDEVGPSLTAVGFFLRALKLPPAQMEELEPALTAAMDAVREVSNSLHLNVVEKSGLQITLEKMVVEARARTSAKIELSTRITNRPPHGPAFAVLRILTLAVDNAVRHATATQINVDVTADGPVLNATVIDDGRGFSTTGFTPELPGLGLIEMESISYYENLKLTVESASGKGTIVKIQTS